MLCGHCLKVKPYFDETIVPFHYQSPISNLITELKFKRKLYNSVVLGVLLAKHLKKQKNLEQPDLIMPVPLHKKRLRERGFNQALEIARLVSKHLQIPLDYQSCVRVRHTTAQASIHAKERKHNIKNAFEVIKPLRAKHIAIIDDVMTTGSTTNEIARVLKKAGVNKVSIWCCARTN